MRISIIATALSAALLGTMGISVANGDDHKVTLCHATSSETNPYNLITVSKNSVAKGNAHAEHHDPGDIIPPFDGYAGRNWFDPYIGYYEAGCQVTDGDPDPLPEEPETPNEEEPEQPVEEEPNVPEVPEEPVVPETPVEPEQPVTPDEPTEPETPVEPTVPDVERPVNNPGTQRPVENDDTWEPFTEVVTEDAQGRKVVERVHNEIPSHLEQTG